MIAGAHYRRLGVAPEASLDEIRAAYRDAARRHHPDTRMSSGTTGSDDEMAAINEAWRVLSDPSLRARYDAELGAGTDSAASSHRGDASSSAGPSSFPDMPAPRLDPFARYQNPPRFPWRFVVILVLVATAAILIVGALTSPGEPAPIDNVIRPGSCVAIDAVRLEVDEVACTEPHDGTVEQVVPFDSRCPSGLEGYRDRQGMGIACVKSVSMTMAP